MLEETLENNSLNESDLEDFVKLSKSLELSDNSWTIDIDKVSKETLDISAKNQTLLKK